MVSSLPVARKNYQKASKPSSEEQLILELVRYGLTAKPIQFGTSVAACCGKLGGHSATFRKQLGQLLVGDASSPLRSAADVAMPVEPETRLPSARFSADLWRIRRSFHQSPLQQSTDLLRRARTRRRSSRQEYNRRERFFLPGLRALASQ